MKARHRFCQAEVKFSLSDTFSFIFTMVSNRFVRECFVVVVFWNPCHFENHFGLFVHILLYISYPIKTIPHQGNFVTTFIISALAVWVLDGRFVTNFVILYLSGSMKFTGQQFFSHVWATPAVARFLGVNQYYAKEAFNCTVEVVFVVKCILLQTCPLPLILLVCTRLPH